MQLLSVYLKSPYSFNKEDMGKLKKLSQIKNCGPQGSQPSECGRQRTLNIVHTQTAAQQQSNGSYETRMSGKC